MTGEIQGIDDAIRVILKSGTIEKNVELAGGKLVERLQNVTGIEARKVIIGFRKQFLNNIGSVTDIKYIEGDNEVNSNKNDATFDFSELLLSNFREDIQNLIISKYNSEKNNKLNRKEITDLIIQTLKETINIEEGNFIRFLEQSGIKIKGDQKDYILLYTNKLLNSEEIKKAIDNVISNGIHRIIASKEPLFEIEKIMIDLAEGKIDSVMGEKTQEITKEKMVESFYEVFLKNKESISSLVGLFKGKIESDFELDNATLENIVEVIKKHLPTEKILELLKENKDILNNLDNPERVKSFSIEVYKTIDNKLGFIDDMSNTGVVDFVKKLGNGESSTMDFLTNNDISKLIDIVYLTLENNNSENLSHTLLPIFKKLGLDKIFKNLEGLGNNGLENSINILKSIEKDKIIDFLIRNKELITEVETAGELNTKQLSQLAVELSQMINMDEFQTLNKDAQGNDKFLIEISDEVQKVINLNPERFRFLTIGAEKLIKEIESGIPSNIDIKGFSEDLFNFIHLVISQLDENFIEEKLNLESEGKNNELLEKIKPQFTQEFIENNFGFSIGAIFTAIGEDKWKNKVIDSYFRDKTNKVGFTNTIIETLNDLK